MSSTPRPKPPPDLIAPPPPAERLLLVDDTPTNLQVLFQTLDGRGYELMIAQTGEEALEVAREARPDLILLDIMMPGIDGFETCRRLKADDELAQSAVIFMSALDDAKDKVKGLDLGAVDYITKPFQAEEVIARVGTHLRLRRLERSLTETNGTLRNLINHLEVKVAERSDQLLKSRDAVIFGLARLAESRDTDTGKHLERISLYVELLLSVLRRSREEIDEKWISTVTTTSALHDIGKVGVPDSVLKKEGRLTDEERLIIQKHTTLGGDTLLALKRQWGDDTFLVTATQIAFAHHEKWDGTGYPFGLAGNDIPFSARVVAVADVYDALTSRRVYKPPMPHEKARQIITGDAGTHFDPAVVEAFLEVEDAFRQIAEEHSDAPGGGNDGSGGDEPGG